MGNSFENLRALGTGNLSLPISLLRRVAEEICGNCLLTISLRVVFTIAFRRKVKSINLRTRTIVVHQLLLFANKGQWCPNGFHCSQFARTILPPAVVLTGTNTTPG